jgi:hypothetical protein
MGADSSFHDRAIRDGSGTSISVASHYPTLTKALATFAEMKPWLRASDRAGNIVEALVQAVSQVPDAAPEGFNTQRKYIHAQALGVGWRSAFVWAAG